MWCYSRWVSRQGDPADHQSHQQLIGPGYSKCWSDSVTPCPIKKVLHISACLDFIWNTFCCNKTALEDIIYRFSNIYWKLQVFEDRGDRVYSQNLGSPCGKETAGGEVLLYRTSVILSTTAMGNTCFHLDRPLLQQENHKRKMVELLIFEVCNCWPWIPFAGIFRNVG